MLVWNNKAEAEMSAAISGRLLPLAEAMAELLVVTHKERISIPAPPHSKPGEYLHKITGRGRASLEWELQNKGIFKRIANLLGFGKPLKVIVRYGDEAPYMTFWENAGLSIKRRSLEQTAASLAAEFSRLANT